MRRGGARRINIIKTIQQRSFSKSPRRGETVNNMVQPEDAVP